MVSGMTVRFGRHKKGGFLPLSFGALVLSAALAAGLILSGAVFSSPAGAAVGGGQTTTTTYTTSTTSGTTFTRKDLPDVAAYSTRVLGYAGSSCNGGEAWLFDQTFTSASASAAVQSAIATATAAVSAQCGDVSTAALDSSSTSSATAYLGDEVDHTEQSVTTTQALGPTSILIGDEQSQTFFVAAGTVNYNTNTHTQTFMNQLYQTTVTTTETWIVKGSGGEQGVVGETPAATPPAAAGADTGLTASAAPASSSSLPSTGLDWTAVLFSSLALIAAGSGLCLRERRR